MVVGWHLHILLNDAFELLHASKDLVTGFSARGFLANDGDRVCILVLGRREDEADASGLLDLVGKDALLANDEAVELLLQRNLKRKAVESLKRGCQLHKNSR